MSADPDKFDVRLRTGVDQIDRVSIHCKIQNGDDLTRDDLHMILRALEDGIASDWAQSITCVIKELPKRIKGYKVKGQGRKAVNKKPFDDLRIALDYEDLLDGEHSFIIGAGGEVFSIQGKFSSSDAFELLSRNSLEFYGRSLSIDAIKNCNTRGKKKRNKRSTS